MKRTMAAGFLVLTALAGCAQTKVETSDGKRGVRYYPIAHPVMVVTKTDSRGTPVKAQLAYLPDTSQPRYVRQRPGLGKSGWTLTCENGVATGFEQTASDGQASTTLEALANAGVAFLAGKGALEELDVIDK